MNTAPIETKDVAPAKPAAAPKNKVMDALTRVKDGVIDKASDVMSAPKRAYYGVKTALAKDDYAKVKQEQSLKAMDKAHVPDAGNESDPLFRYRINTINAAFDAEHERKNN